MSAAGSQANGTNPAVHYHVDFRRSWTWLITSSDTGAGAAGAATRATRVNHFVGANNLCLDSNITGSRPGRGDAFVQGASGSGLQSWHWAGTIPSEWVIINKASGLCLNSIGVDYVYVTECGSTDTWRIVRPAGGGLPWIVNVPQGNNGCLTMVGADVRTRTCDTRNSTQRWRII